ncbi:MAG: hypothetical protein J1F42_01695 [Lachnospiraceae bacterium]|nr:hypothetical protein [Lachnospiraceae bacterium]
MLPPDYFTNKEDRLLELYRQLEDFILKDITRRLLAAGEMTSTADQLIYKLQMMGESREEIQKKLSEMTGLTREELRAILQDAVLTSWEDDASTLKQLGVELSNPLENAAVVRVMDAEYKKSLGELTNLTRTTMEQSQQDLINMLDEADLRVASGVQSYSAAVCDILDRYAGKGIEVLYPTGTKRTLEAAVRCCVVTSMNQTAAQVTNQYIVEAKSEYVLVSAHLGARTQPEGQPTLAGHDNWQGRVYRIVGSEPEYPNLLESTGYDIEPGTGIGKVVNPLGLHGYNCRHSHKPWDIRLRNPYVDENGNLKIDGEENKKRYELQQKQRAMERAIRKTKRELVTKQQEIDSVAETDVKSILQEDYDKLAVKLTKQNQAYNDFCKDNNLQPQYDRIKAAGFGRKQEKATNKAVAEYQNEHTPYAKLQKKANTLGAGDAEGDNSQPRYIGKIDTDKTNEAITYFGNQIRNSGIEHVYIINDKGKVYYNRGVNNRVSIGNIDLANCHVLHNHPVSNGITSFGKDDFMVIRDNPLSIWHLVNPKYDYNLTVLKPLDDVVYNQIYLEALAGADVGDDVQDLVMKVLAEGGYIKYEKRKLDS